jgi:LCP family protein required for cell wall assembly
MAFLLTAVLSGIGGAVVGLWLPELLVSSSFQPNSPFATPADQLSPLLPSSWQYRLSQPVNILVVGVDPVAATGEDSRSNRFGGRSDTVLLVRFDPANQTINLLSIPRDTKVRLPDADVDTVNQANYFGGEKMMVAAVQQLLHDVPIHRYVRVSTGALRELVDLLGGVEVYVPQKMTYEDKTQQLTIELLPGWQTLDGEKAEQFARFRQGNLGDIGRVQRQQMLLLGLRKRLNDPAMIPRLPQVVRVMQKYVDTDLVWQEMVALVKFALDVDRRDFRMVMLPGEFGRRGYWLPDRVARDRIVQKYFQVEPPQLSRQRQRYLQTNRDPASLQIAVQNTTNHPQATQKMVDYLQSQGFTDTYVLDSWQDRQFQTQIIVQKGYLEGAKALQELLGFGEIAVMSTGELDSDFTIRLGEDWVEMMAESAK